jgi:hypothetical protein
MKKRSRSVRSTGARNSRSGVGGSLGGRGKRTAAPNLSLFSSKRRGVIASRNLQKPPWGQNSFFLKKSRLDLDLNRYSYIQPLGRAPLIEKKITMMSYRGAHSNVNFSSSKRSTLRKKFEADAQTDKETPLF